MLCRGFILAALLLSLLSGRVTAQTAAPVAPALCNMTGKDDPVDREAACLSELSGRVSRTGETLTIRLETGKLKTYRNNSKACENDDAQRCVGYVLLGYHPQGSVYAIQLSFYEGSGVELLSARSGAILRVSGTPYFTPDGSRFVAIDNDYVHGEEHDLSIGTAANGKLAMEWQSRRVDESRQWRFERWIDNDRVALQVLPADSEQKCPVADCEAFVVRVGKRGAVRPSPLPW